MILVTFRRFVNTYAGGVASGFAGKFWRKYKMDFAWVFNFWAKFVDKNGRHPSDFKFFKFFEKFEKKTVGRLQLIKIEELQ